MSYFPEDIPFMSKEELRENRIRIPKDVPDTNVGDIINRQQAINVMCLACGHDCDKSKFVYNAPQDEQVIICPEHYALSTLLPVQLEIITCDECITPKRSECIWHNAGATYCSFAERRTDG